VVLKTGSIAGEVLTPFFTEADEGFDVNRPKDWKLLELALAAGEASLPIVREAPFSAT
jgi:hypothetical protein